MWPKISTNKLEAAKRQINVAIGLLFARTDPLAVNTLAYAAFQLLFDIAKAQGDSPTVNQMIEDASLWDKKEFWNEFKMLSNFLKHADRDADSTISNVDEDYNESVLATCCCILREIDRIDSSEQYALWLWQHSLVFISISDCPPCFGGWLMENYEKFHEGDRDAYLRAGNELLDKLKLNRNLLERFA